MRKILIFIILAFLLVLCAAPAYAQPTLPHAFYGSVLINGSAAPNGTQVSAKVDNGTVIPTQNPVSTAGGSYGVDSPRLLVQGAITPGATITFYVRGVAAEGQTATFEAGGGPTKQDLSVTVVAPAPPPPVGDDGGIGVPPLPPGTTDVRGMVGTGCRFTKTATAISEDGLCTLTIPEGTVCLTEELGCLTKITMLEMDEPPPPPADAHVIGLVYDFGPDGVNFDPPATLTFSYDPADIPEGVAEEDLVIAYYDEEAGEWVELEGCVVDTENNTITASISHFTTFVAMIAIPPAAFTSNSLVISPAEVAPDEKVNISISVVNTGGREGRYTVVLEINGVKEAEKAIRIAPSESQEVSFSVARKEAGSYSVDVDGLSGSFTVVAPAAPPPKAPPPAPPAPTPPAPELVPAPAPPAPPAPLITWPVVFAILLGVVVVGIVIFFLIRRRAH